jgi:hypothetical protein
LIQRKEPKKNQGKPERSERFAKPHANFVYTAIVGVTNNKI